jgi:hypothetical protein
MMAATRALSIRPTPNRHFCVAGNVRPHVNQVSAESALGAELMMDRAWPLLTFGDATLVHGGFRSLEPFAGPVGAGFADGNQRLCPPVSDEGH